MTQKLTKTHRSVSLPSRLHEGLSRASSFVSAVTAARSEKQDKDSTSDQQPSIEDMMARAGSMLAAPSISPRMQPPQGSPSGTNGVRAGAPPPGARASLGRRRHVSDVGPGRPIGPLLGPLFGTKTTEANARLFQRMLRAQQARSGGQAVADLFEDEALLTALMRRDAPQEGAVQELASAPIERAFESILTDEVFGQMPRRMGDQMGQLGRAMAETLDHLSPERAERVIKHAILDLQKEHPRAWSKKAPLLTYLCQNQSETLQAKKQRLIVGLRRDVADGFDALTVMVLMRSCFLGLKGAGLDLIIAPWLRQADQVYGKSILEYKGKSQANHLGEYPKDAVVGITGLGQNSPVHAEDLTPALRANNRGVPDLNKEEIAAAVMFGNPFVSGPSGTTNMFLHAVSYFNEKGTTNIDGSALTTLLATLLCYDGGHSIHEVFSVAHLLSSLPKSQLSTFLGYTSGHARGLYVDLAEQAGSVNVSGKALKRLYAHFHDEEVRPKTLLQF